MRRVGLVLLLLLPSWERPVGAEPPQQRPAVVEVEPLKPKRRKPPRLRPPRHRYTYTFTDRVHKPVPKDECEWRNREARTRARDWGIEERHRASLALPKCPPSNELAIPPRN